MSEIKQFLKRFELFIGLSDEMLDKVVELCQVKKFTPGATIVERNSAADNFFLIREGTVEIITAAGDGSSSDSVIVTLGKGQTFGEMSLVDSGARSATVNSATEVSLYEINSAAFRTLCEKDTDLGYQIMKNIAVDLSFKLRYRNLI